MPSFNFQNIYTVEAFDSEVEDVVSYRFPAKDLDDALRKFRKVHPSKRDVAIAKIEETGQGIHTYED
jgi:hypothetical protein